MAIAREGGRVRDVHSAAEPNRAPLQVHPTVRSALGAIESELAQRDDRGRGRPRGPARRDPVRAVVAPARRPGHNCRAMRRARGLGRAAGLVLALGLGTAACSGGGPHSSSATTSSTTRAAPRVPAPTTSTTGTKAGPPPRRPSASTTTSSAASGAAPTLGLAGAFGAGGAGFGQVRPTEISLGGDPTGILSGITWQSWGGSQAIGTGTSTYVGPGQTVAQGTQETATVVAFDLGTCGGAPAYQQVSWYFPQQGQTPADNGSTPIDACTGP